MVEYLIVRMFIANAVDGATVHVPFPVGDNLSSTQRDTLYDIAKGRNITINFWSTQ